MEFKNEIETIDLTKLNPPLVAILRFSEYQAEAMKTASMGKGRELEGFVRVCGLVGEASELRAELVRWTGPVKDAAPNEQDLVEKELGDVLWYAATLAEWLQLGVHFDFSTLQAAAGRCQFEEGIKNVVLARAGKLAELMKKHLGHDKPLNGSELVLMQDVFMAIAHVANAVGADLAYVAAKNIQKLRARYQGGGFTTTLANAHVDERALKEGESPRLATELTREEYVASEDERTEQQAENDGDLS